MAGTRTGIQLDANLMNLKEMSPKEVRREVFEFLVPGESIIQCFKTVRDQVIFTDKRVFVLNVQGVTGKKVSYFSYPYSKISYYGIETAGLMDIDSEMIMTFSNGTVLQFDFKSQVDIKTICMNIQRYIL